MCCAINQAVVLKAVPLLFCMLDNRKRQSYLKEGNENCLNLSTISFHTHILVFIRRTTGKIINDSLYANSKCKVSDFYDFFINGKVWTSDI